MWDEEQGQKPQSEEFDMYTHNTHTYEDNGQS